MVMFSVLLPSRDRLDLLKLAIASVLEQDFRNFEIIVSDNASQESYDPYISSLNDPRVRYIRVTTPLSVSENWSRALSAARGQYVIMLGDDDALTPGALSRIRKMIIKHRRPDVLYMMAYHYLYPDVDPTHPDGLFSLVSNSPLFNRHKHSYMLDPAESPAYSAGICRFKLKVSMNAQHFVWRRDFVDAAKGIFRAPYPDYYAAMYTFSNSRRIAITGEALVIIGIAKQSFGYFFRNNRQEEGEKVFENKSETNSWATSEQLNAALSFPGSIHYKNWLLSTIEAVKYIDNTFFIDVEQYKKVQIIEAVAENMVNGSTIVDAQLKADPMMRPFVEETMSYFCTALPDASQRSTSSVNAYKGVALDRIGLYVPSISTLIPLGDHHNIMDAFNYLRSIDEGTSVPIESRITHYIAGNDMRASIEKRNAEIEQLHREYKRTIEKNKDLSNAYKSVRESQTLIAQRYRILSAREIELHNDISKLRDELRCTHGKLAEARQKCSAAARRLEKVVNSVVWQLASKLGLTPSLADTAAVAGNAAAKVAEGGTQGTNASTLVTVAHCPIDVWAQAKASALSNGFDAAFYLEAYPDVRAARSDPLQHYVEFGRAEGRRMRGSDSAVGTYTPVFAEPHLSDSEFKLVQDFSKMYYDKLDEGRGLHTVIVSWMGYSMFKCPLDLWIYQELICREMFDLIIEVGTYKGGSALFLAHMLELTGCEAEVLSIDISEEYASERPVHGRIRYIHGSSLDPHIFAMVEDATSGKRKPLVILDGDHRSEHVLEELRLYSGLVPMGGYLIVEDTNVNGHPAFEGYGPGPWEAVSEFLAENHEFEADRSCERFLLTMNPRGFLRRIASAR